MNTNPTGPEEKGFFEKVKENIEQLWEGTKEETVELKDKAADEIDDLKSKI